MLLRLDWCYSSLYEDAYPILLLVLLMVKLILLKKANGYLAAYWLLQKAKAWQQLDKMLMTAYSQFGKKLTVVIWLRDCSFVVCLNESIQPSGPLCLWQFVPLTMFHGTLCVIATANNNNNNKSTNKVNFKKQITWNHCWNWQSKKTNFSTEPFRSNKVLASTWPACQMNFTGLQEHYNQLLANDNALPRRSEINFLIIRFLVSLNISFKIFRHIGRVKNSKEISFASK